ncbi:hypothetical protein [Persicitalea jodogahamensis]|uniref:6-phosphogluconate dehydrogenase n=1 Tax=Persicitalea jodogahamensis TaxID=402147 RepID=A0A8J3DDD2_9BACT|nr:hypothetical protein [Persicitalea jodogahamensis]GHB85422.1 hypothetical protein GCM10007390_45980 [Persicitalea jodogahamensis]
MRKWVILGIFLLIVFGIFYYLTFGYYSEGKRGGFVIKLSKRGFVFKTHEGVLNVGGLFEGGGTLSANQWDFSVDADNEAAVSKLEEGIKTGRRVSLTYEEKFFILPWNGDTKYFITNVELLDTPVMPQQNPMYQQQPQQQQLPPPAPVEQQRADSTAVF